VFIDYLFGQEPVSQHLLVESGFSTHSGALVAQESCIDEKNATIIRQVL
jgi:hypothetical protein